LRQGETLEKLEKLEKCGSRAMGAAIKKRRRGGGMVEINMTPLVDVMLVLLVVFMVAAPLLVTGIPLQLPQSRASATQAEEKPMVLSITAEGRAFLGEADVTADVQRGLLADPRISQKLPLYVRADRDVKYGVVARAIAEARAAGIAAVTLLVEPEAGKP
jgi:biopolymer transport protein TolR